MRSKCGKQDQGKEPAAAQNHGISAQHRCRIGVQHLCHSAARCAVTLPCDSNASAVRPTARGNESARTLLLKMGWVRHAKGQAFEFLSVG